MEPGAIQAAQVLLSQDGLYLLTERFDLWGGVQAFVRELVVQAGLEWKVSALGRRGGSDRSAEEEGLRKFWIEPVVPNFEAAPDDAAPQKLDDRELPPEFDLLAIGKPILSVPHGVVHGDANVIQAPIDV